MTFGTKGEGKWEHAPRGAGLGSASIHFIQPFKKRVLSRNVDQNMRIGAAMSFTTWPWF